MYKYLIFDLDDTLLDFKKAEETAIKKVFEKFGIDNSDKTVALYSEINQHFWKSFEKGKIKREDIFEGRFNALAKKLDISFDAEKINNAYFNALSLCGFAFKGADRLLNGLSKKYTLCAATNGNLITQSTRIAYSGLAGYFSGGIFISERMGYKKPEREFFDCILNHLGNPEKDLVLVIGDSVSSDIDGAFNAGLDSCFVNLRGQQAPDSLTAKFTVTALEDIPVVCGLQ